jgi:hypothetical protein
MMENVKDERISDRLLEIGAHGTQHYRYHSQASAARLIQIKRARER